MMIRFMIGLFLWLEFSTAANSAYTPCSLCIDRASSSELAKTQLRLYTGSSLTEYTTEPAVGKAFKLFGKLDNRKPTIVYIFGWTGSPSQTTTEEVISACLTRGDHNTMLFDWSKIAAREYTFATRSVEGVGYVLAMALNGLVAAGMSSSGFHIVGHSLGAQISGYTGKYVNFTLPRITALDPAAPGFYFAAKNVGSGDARFVVLMHVNYGGFGIAEESGDVDFFVNGGSFQPGCFGRKFGCSHDRAPSYYAESLLNENSLIGLACDSHFNFKAGSCSLNTTAVMGYATPTNASGRYYLQTNSESPYGRGKEGTRYKA